MAYNTFFTKFKTANSTINNLNKVVLPLHLYLEYILSLKCVNAYTLTQVKIIKFAVRNWSHVAVSGNSGNPECQILLVTVRPIGELEKENNEI